MPGGDVASLERGAGALAEQGYSVVAGFLDGAARVAVGAAVDMVLQAPPVPGCERPHNRLVPLRWNEAVVDLILADEGRRRTVAAICGGDDLRWISGYISVKDPRTPALCWHQDWWCWRHPVSFQAAAPQVALLVYLSDTSECTGALRVLPSPIARACRCMRP
jgi:hypothetical protein